MAGDITNPQSLNRYAYALNNPTTLIDPLGLQGGDPCERNPNRIICGNDAWHSGPPPALFGSDQFDLAAKGFLPGSSLPSGICPAEYQSCVVYPNGVIIGKNGNGTTAFTFGQSLNGAGTPCSARDVEAGDCSVSGINVIGVGDLNPAGPTIGPAPDNRPGIQAAPTPGKPSCFDYYVSELTGASVSGLASLLFRDTAVDKAATAAAPVLYDPAFRAGVKGAVPGLGMTASRFAWVGRSLKWMGVASAVATDIQAVVATGKMIQAKFSGGCTSPTW